MEGKALMVGRLIGDDEQGGDAKDDGAPEASQRCRGW